jgi:hypothetical protein
MTLEIEDRRKYNHYIRKYGLNEKYSITQDKESMG